MEISLRLLISDCGTFVFLICKWKLYIVRTVSLCREKCIFTYLSWSVSWLEAPILNLMHMHFLGFGVNSGFCSGKDSEQQRWRSSRWGILGFGALSPFVAWTLTWIGSNMQGAWESKGGQSWLVSWQAKSMGVRHSYHAPHRMMMMLSFSHILYWIRMPEQSPSATLSIQKKTLNLKLKMKGSYRFLQGRAVVCHRSHCH